MLELNKIYNEDCLITMSKMEDKSIDIVLTDPPYGINVGTPVRERERELKSGLPQSPLVKVGIKGLSIPKVIRGLMTEQPRQKNVLTK
jgi:DNA modification methylase